MRKYFGTDGVRGRVGVSPITPEFVMNMILNPQEMVERHPVAKQMLAERMTFMANQNLTLDEARAVLEYLRTQAKGGPK